MSVRFRVLRGSAATPGARASPAPLVEREVEVAGAPSEIRVGRSPDVELPLPFAALSGVHVRVERTLDGSGWIVEDARSTNGTWVDGARLAPGERRALAPGAELVLGNVRLRFDGEGPPAPDAQGTATIARRLVDDLFAASPAQTPALRVVRGAPPRRLALTEPGRAYVAGRAAACALSLDVEEVSREHASFTREELGVVVRDLGSKNGVVFAGSRLRGELLLSDGDVVEIGPVAVALEDPVARYLRELESPAPPIPAPPSATAAPPEIAPAEPRSRRSMSMSRLAVLVSATVLALLAATIIVLLR